MFPNPKFLISFLLTFQSFHVSLNSLPLPAPRIAVIGGGIGGASCSYFLRKLFGDSVQIDLYEPNNVGGRLKTIQIGNEWYEAGGSVIHNRNRYMTNFLEDLHLNRTKNPNGRLGLYDGIKFVFEESRYEAWTYFELFWRYGLSMFKWNALMDEMMDKFDKVYDLQDDGYSYTTVEELIKNIDASFYDMTRVTTEELLSKKGFSKEFIDELALAATRVNYGQSTDINGFVGALSLAAAQPKLWSAKGGNFQLPKGAIQLSNTNLVRNRVTSLTFKDNGKYIVTSTPPGENLNFDTEYEIVIIACPQTHDHDILTLKNIPDVEFPGNYHHLVATFVQGNVNSSHFLITNPSDMLDDVITINLAVPYNSLSRNYDVGGSGSKKTKVFKIFSSNVLSDELLEELFVSRDVSKSVTWLAYPEYKAPQRLGGFKIHSRLYYTSAIEWAGSAMEMSAISGRNVALLAFNEYNNIDKVDVAYVKDVKKDEL